MNWFTRPTSNRIAWGVFWLALLLFLYSLATGLERNWAVQERSCDAKGGMLVKDTLGKTVCLDKKVILNDTARD